MNMNEGPKDGAKGGEIEGRRWEWVGQEVGVGRVGESGGGKIVTTVFERQ